MYEYKCFADFFFGQVIADESSNPAFVASDLLSQAEHGTDSQVVLIGVNVTSSHISAIEEEVDRQARLLPRVDIVRESIGKSLMIGVGSLKEAMELSNEYAPEHLIVNLENTEGVLEMVENAGSVFIGPYTPERLVRLSSFLECALIAFLIAVVIMRLARITLCRRMGLQNSTVV